MAHRTVVHAGLVLKNLLASELQSSLGSKDRFILIGLFCKRDQFLKLFRHHTFVLFTVHVHYTFYRFFPSLVTTLTLHPPGVPHVKLGLGHHFFTNTAVNQLKLLSSIT